MRDDGTLYKAEFDTRELKRGKVELTLSCDLDQLEVVFAEIVKNMDRVVNPPVNVVKISSLSEFK